MCWFSLPDRKAYCMGFTYRLDEPSCPIPRIRLDWVKMLLGSIVWATRYCHSHQRASFCRMALCDLMLLRSY